MKNTVITTPAGGVLAVRILEKGDQYGPDNSHIFPSPDSWFEEEQARLGNSLVEFWDVELAECIYRLYLNDLRHNSKGQTLRGGMGDRWRISGQNTHDILSFALGGAVVLYAT